MVDDTGFPNVGTPSSGVARQYTGTLGKIGNCQISVSVYAVTDQASCPLDWRLFVPASWDEQAATAEEAEQVRARRAKAGLPQAVRPRPKWELALQMLDELAGWGHRPPVVVADAGYGQNGAWRTALGERQIT
ncbi:transposase [Pseudarthrobacter sp. NPDC058196]|uniref:transposase n=1 Tax=Pseudarthrobacter sp. NPDC058196 TaxID=3346376 RepID=UPI0036DC43DF